MTRTLTPDICVIGGGASGLALSVQAAAGGASVVLIEKNRVGARLERGCLSLQALAAAGRQAQAMRHASGFGLADVEPQIDFRQTRRHMRETVAASAPNRSAERLSALGVLVLEAQARFEDERTVIAGEHSVRAGHFVIACGSTPRLPQIAGLDTVDWLDCETALESNRHPGRLVVAGGAPEGLELAQAFARLGTQAIVITPQEALPGFDPELAAILIEQLRGEGIDIREHVSPQRVERRGKTAIRLHINEDEAIDGTHLVVAAGRQPAIDGLAPERARIAFCERGIRVTDRLRTTNRRVYAIGGIAAHDAAAPRPARASSHQAALVLRQILSGETARYDPRIVPHVVFTAPELAHVGLNEGEARQAHARIKVLRWPYAENERAQAGRHTTGFIKLITASDGRILGVSIVGEHAGELIGIWALALAQELNVRDMANAVPACPTIGEIGKQAAISYFSGTTRKGVAQRMLRLLRMRS